MNDKNYTIKLELTIDQIQTLIQHIESEKSKSFFDPNKEKFNNWNKVRDELSHHLVMLTENPWKT